MEITKKLLQKYDLLKNSLLMLTYPQDVAEEAIEESLEELEGDIYTFLHNDNLFDLKKNHYLQKKQMEEIIQLRIKVQNMPGHLWNKNDFKQNELWSEIHKKANDILMSLEAI